MAHQLFFLFQTVVPRFYDMMRQLCEIRAALVGVSNEAFEQQQVRLRSSRQG